MYSWRPSERWRRGKFLQMASGGARAAVRPKFEASGAGYETGRPVVRTVGVAVGWRLLVVAGIGTIRWSWKHGRRVPPGTNRTNGAVQRRDWEAPHNNAVLPTLTRNCSSGHFSCIPYPSTQYPVAPSDVDTIHFGHSHLEPWSPSKRACPSPVLDQAGKAACWPLVHNSLARFIRPVHRWVVRDRELARAGRTC